MNLLHIVEVIVGFTGGYILSRTVLLRIEYKIVDLIHRFQDYRDDVPHIDENMYEEALDKILRSPDFAEISRSGDTYKICPKCRSFKRSFYKDGRKRICMDCEFHV